MNLVFSNCNNFKAEGASTLAITDTKPYVPVVTFSTQLLQQLNQDLCKQSTGTNINQMYQCKRKTAT